MGAAKEKRDLIASRREFDLKQKNNPYRPYLDEIGRLENLNSFQAEQIESLKSRLAEVEAERDTLAFKIVLLAVTLADAFKWGATWKIERNRWFQAFMAKEKSWKKLSAVVRVGMSADDFHLARQDAAEVYPQLFADTD